MMTRGIRGRFIAIGAALAASSLSMLATSPAASADTMRTLNLSISCAGGEAYGLQVNDGTGNGFYTPAGTSSMVGGVKDFVVAIHASGTYLWVMPVACDGEPTGAYGQSAIWDPYYITPGTSTINARAFCQDYNYYGELLFDCSISNVSYS